MHSKMLMQLKRELWEHKALVINVPLILSAVLSLMCVVAFSAVIINKHIHFSVSGNINFTTQTVTQEAIFDLTHETTDGFSSRDYRFENSPLGIRESHPELEIYPLNTAEIKRSTHQYKETVNDRISQTLNIFERLVLFAMICIVVAVFSSDQRNKSVLFWRSMPLSETTVVLAKLLASLVVTPATYLISLYLLIGVALAMFSLAEGQLPFENTYALSKVMWDTYANMVQMAGTFAFQVYWFLPLFVMLAMSVTLFKIYGLPIFAFVFILVLGLESALLAVNDMRGFLSAYLDYGVDATLNAKFNVLWSGNYPTINYLWLLYATVINVLLIAALVIIRKRQAF